MNTFKEASFFVRDGVTYYLKDERAREMLAELITSSKEKYGPDNPPPYPVTSVNGQTGDVSIDTGVLSIRADYPGGGTGVNKGDVSIVGSGCLVHTLYPGRVEVQASKNTIGLGSVANERQYSANNPPPYPVKSVNGQTGDVSVSVPTKVSDLTNDLGFVDSAGAAAVAPVQSVNGQTGNVSISVPTEVSDLTNDLGFVDAAGAAAAAPVQSVNGQTGNVSVPKTVNAMLSCEFVSTASGARNAWPIGTNSPPLGDNLTLTVRNASTGAVHVIWYYSNDRTFEVAATLIGNAPNAGDIVFVTYQA